jgi:serine/threonine-protein kinase HipA
MLLGGVVLHVLDGNGDAHAKNYSLLHEPSGALTLAPLYDVMSTLYYGDDRLAMYVDDVQRTDRVISSRIINEASAWNMFRWRAGEIADALLERVPAAVDRAAVVTPELPNEILAILDAQSRGGALRRHDHDRL